MPEPKGPQVEIPPELVEELQTELPAAGDAPAEEVGELRRQLEELNEKYLRLAAEYDNFRRRSLRERQDVLKYANENLVKELLTSVDNLERAIAHDVRHALQAMGHELFPYGEIPPGTPYGGGQAILIDRERGVLQGGSDHRKDGCAIGY